LRRGCLRPSLSVQIIEDDESYFTLDGSNHYGHDHYFSHPLLETPENVKFIYKRKFQPKVLVWIAISPYGLSQPYIVPTKGFAINAKIYINECIKKRLMKFINKFHSDNNYIFWPDLASSHYAKDSIAAFNKLGIKYVLKEENPPNVPQLRGIERFWAHLKRNVYENGWTAKTAEELIKKIKSEIKKFGPENCQALLQGTKTKIRKAADNGPLSVIN
jgi:transposase